MSSWIKMIKDSEADEHLTEALNLAKTPHGTVDNVMRAHSLRPSTMKGHFGLYQSVLHDDANTIPEWFQETISSYVSILNKCQYSLANHWANACHLKGDSVWSTKVKIALENHNPEAEFDGAQLQLLKYAEKLTLRPSDMVKNDIIKLRNSGVSDGEILEANQIICYFNYVNRSINGLGITTDGDKVGYYSLEKKQKL